MDRLLLWYTQVQFGLWEPIYSCLFFSLATEEMSVCTNAQCNCKSDQLFFILFTDRVCQQQGLSLWVPFQNAATAVTNLYKGK